MNIVQQITDGIVDAALTFFNLVIDNIYSALVWLMQEMLKLISKFPYMVDVPEIYTVWKLMTCISLACVGLIVVYMAFESFAGSASAMKSLELKNLIGRIMYAVIFIACSRIFIDFLIKINNTLVEIFILKFDIAGSFNHIKTDNFIGNIVAAALIAYQMYLAIKIMIGYWIRVAEVFLMYVASPAMCILWIKWQSHLGNWISRLSTLIFTQFTQILIMVLYSKLIYRFFEAGSISNLCLAAACLILMTNTPGWLQQFIAPNNSFDIMHKTYSQVKGKVNPIKNKIANIRKHK